jgi:hypothetical protein
MKWRNINDAVGNSHFLLQTLLFYCKLFVECVLFALYWWRSDTIALHDRVYNSRKYVIPWYELVLHDIVPVPFCVYECQVADTCYSTVMWLVATKIIQPSEHSWMNKIDAFRSGGLSHKIDRSELSWCSQGPQVNVDTATRNVAFYDMSQITTRPFCATVLIVFH